MDLDHGPGRSPRGLVVTTRGIFELSKPRALLIDYEFSIL